MVIADSLRDAKVGAEKGGVTRQGEDAGITKGKGRGGGKIGSGFVALGP
jgi:hypothetical protein